MNSTRADGERGIQGREVVRLHTTAQLARILEVPASTVRGWVRWGLLEPARESRRLCFFDFQQLANARTLSRLARMGLAPARIRAGLDRLGRWAPDARSSLGRLEALERRGPLLVRLEDGRLAETSGQLLLDFERPAGAGTAPRPAPVMVSRPAAAGRAVDWFQRGLRAEEEADLESAVTAYQRALRQDHTRPETWFNLGNVLYALGRKAEASRAFTRATGLDPEYVEAWNNLGNTLSDEGRPEEAVQAYEQALATMPAYMDAHYNLAETLESIGQRSRAMHHWREYLRLDPNSRWAQKARDRLRDSS